MGKNSMRDFQLKLYVHFNLALRAMCSAFLVLEFIALILFVKHVN
jgi:hypothetical protein